VYASVHKDNNNYSSLECAVYCQYGTQNGLVVTFDVITAVTGLSLKRWHLFINVTRRYIPDDSNIDNEVIHSWTYAYK
jgi:hypothetical protein